MGGGSSCCHHHHPLCQSAVRLSAVGCYVHEPSPADDASVRTGDAGSPRSLASSMSSVTDCSGSRKAHSCQCEDTAPGDCEDATRPPINPAVHPAPSTNRVCVVQGLLRTDDDSGLASEVRNLHLCPCFSLLLRFKPLCHTMCIL